MARSAANRAAAGSRDAAPGNFDVFALHIPPQALLTIENSFQISLLTLG